MKCFRRYGCRGFAPAAATTCRPRLRPGSTASRTRGRLAEFEVDAGDAEGDPPDYPAPADTQPERLLERAQLAGRLLVAIEALPAAQREAFLLATEGGLTVEEIGNATGTGFETAKSRLRYAYSRLRTELGNLQ
ncbi:MAG: hypothetical protein NT042_09685 [Sulfuritalea sp.]|nr:hypothetical protein [Sulfuritalea sp.]